MIDVVEINRKLDKRSANYANACNNLADFYIRTGQYVKALPLLLESLKIFHSIFPGYDNNLFPPYINLSTVYKAMGRFSDAEATLLELRNMLPPDNPMKNLSLKSNFVSLYTDMGQFEKAESGINDMLPYAEQKFGIDSWEHAISLLVSSKYHYILKDYAKAEGFANNAIVTLKKYQERYKSEMPAVLTNLAYIYYFTGRYIAADSLFSQNLEWYKKNGGKENPQYSINSNGKSLALIELGKYEEAINLLKEGLSIQEKLKNENSSIYANLLNNLAIAYPKIGRTEKSESVLLRSLKITEQIFGIDHPEYRQVCFNLAAMYWDIKRPKEALHYYKIGMRIIKEQVKQIFSYSSEEEKMRFRNTFAIDRNKYYSFIYQEKIKEQNGDLYDNNLYSKGLLLNSMKQISSDIRNSKDKTAIELFADWQKNKKQLAFWYSKPKSDRQINIDSLKKQTEQVEKKLVRLSAAFGKNQESGSINWKTIQRHLNAGEASIEFTSFYYFDKARFTDSILYVAIINKKDSEIPELVTLFEEKQLDTLMKVMSGDSRMKVNQFYITQPGNSSLYDLIWSSIDKKLTNIKTVYFSPTGLLHKISFAAIQVNKDTLLMDKYRLIELNSTKWILESDIQNINKTDSLILYGGIAYDADSAKLKMLAGNDASIIINESTRMLNYSGEKSWKYLPFTRTEVEEINKKGIENQYPVAIISDEYATEESLKALDGKRSPAVLHIASHGFFFPDPNEMNDRKNELVFKYAAEPLLRSGIFFAGAYYTWTKNKPITGIEDGIATAYEIANIYLPNTKLCVLSACETGLGDLYGSEGVVGLQRAFRIAGVKNLVMSLWKVPDLETAEFMSIFYDHLSNNKKFQMHFIIHNHL